MYMFDPRAQKYIDNKTMNMFPNLVKMIVGFFVVAWIIAQFI